MFHGDLTVANPSSSFWKGRRDSEQELYLKPWRSSLFSFFGCWIYSPIRQQWIKNTKSASSRHQSQQNVHHVLPSKMEFSDNKHHIDDVFFSWRLLCSCLPSQMFKWRTPLFHLLSFRRTAHFLLQEPPSSAQLCRTCWNKLGQEGNEFSPWKKWKDFLFARHFLPLLTLSPDVEWTFQGWPALSEGRGVMRGKG